MVKETVDVPDCWDRKRKHWSFQRNFGEANFPVGFNGCTPRIIAEHNGALRSGLIPNTGHVLPPIEVLPIQREANTEADPSVRLTLAASNNAAKLTFSRHAMLIYSLIMPHLGIKAQSQAPDGRNCKQERYKMELPLPSSVSAYQFMGNAW